MIILSFQVLGPKEHELAEQNEYNFDHPDAFDFDLLIKTLRRLKEGKKVEVPIYNFLTHSREKHSVSIYHMYMYADTGTCLYAGNVEQSGSVYLDL